MAAKLILENMQIVASTADEVVKILREVNSMSEMQPVYTEEIIVCPECANPAYEDTEREHIVRCTNCGCEYLNE